jgi:hypothetical protein
MEYISKIDNKSFTTREGLVDHLLKYFSMEVAESDYKSIIDRIQSDNPLVEVESIEKGKKDELIINVSYSNKEGKHLGGERVIIGKVDSYDYYEEMVCDNLDEAISYVSSYYKKADDVEHLVMTKFESYSFSFDSIYTAGIDNNASIYFSFMSNGETFNMSYNFGDSLEQLYNQINSKFTREIEGTVENCWDHCSSSEIFRIDGVEVRDFLKDGKRVRIELLD